jgi:uncharacterized protein YrzB (UPF0473 family)
VSEENGTGQDVITVSDEDGNERVFKVLEHLEVDDHHYVIVVPSGAGAEEPATMLRVDNDDTLVGVDDDEEFQRVVDELERERDDIEIELADPDTAKS